MIRLGFLATVLFCFGCQCPNLPELYSVEIVSIPDLKPNEIRIEFTRDLSECVNGTAHRGFAKQNLQVDDAKLNGQPLEAKHFERNGYNWVQYIPETQPQFPQYEVTFSFGGKLYETDYSKAKILKDRIVIEAKPHVEQK